MLNQKYFNNFVNDIITKYIIFNNYEIEETIEYSIIEECEQPRPKGRGFERSPFTRLSY